MLTGLADRSLHADVLATLGDVYMRAGQMAVARRWYARSFDLVNAAERIYGQLKEAGIEVLYDDRAERAGVKFNDADLIGNPVRVSVSTRTLGKGEAEIKLRSADEAFFVSLAEVKATVRDMLDELYAGLTGDAPAAITTSAESGETAHVS